MSESPRLSVIIPFHDCAASIRAILDDLHRQQLAMEIIAVDDASTDGGPAIVADWAHSHPEYPVRIIHSRHRIYSLGARLEGMRQAAAPFILSLDADDRLLGTQRLRRALHMMEETNCDILHFRTAGILPPSPVHQPLSWTEPFAGHLQGLDIVRAFLACPYPPAQIWNKLLSRQLVRRLVETIPDVRVRYFDVKLLLTLAMLLAREYRSCNELIYEYHMRTFRTSELYAKQVDALYTIHDALLPLFQNTNDGALVSAFQKYMRQRIIIQTGHLCMSLCSGRAFSYPALSAALKKEIFPCLETETLFHALCTSCSANAARLTGWQSKLSRLCPAPAPAENHTSPQEAWESLRSARQQAVQGKTMPDEELLRYGLLFGRSIAPGMGENIRLFSPPLPECSAAPSEDILPVILGGNAAMGALITGILSPS